MTINDLYLLNLTTTVMCNFRSNYHMSYNIDLDNNTICLKEGSDEYSKCNYKLCFFVLSFTVCLPL